MICLSFERNDFVMSPKRVEKIFILSIILKFKYLHKFEFLYSIEQKCVLKFGFGGLGLVE